MILKGFAVDEEAAVVVEMEAVGVPIRGTLRSGWSDPGWVVGLSCWRFGPSELSCGNGMGLVGGRGGVMEAGSFATPRMTGSVRGCGVGSRCLRGVG